MRRSHLRAFFVAIVQILLVSAMSTVPRAAPAALAAGAAAPSARVIAASGDGLTLEVVVPDIDVSPIEHAGIERQVVGIPGGGFRRGADGRLLPVWTRLVALPAPRNVAVGVVAADRRPLDGRFDLLDYAAYQQRNGNVAAAARAGDFAADAPVLAGPVGTMRGIAVVPITVSPVDYDPQSGTITLASRLVVQLEYGAANGAVDPQADRPLPASFDRLYRQTLLNYDTVLAQSGRAIIPQGSYALIHGGDPVALETLQPLLDWRRRQGYQVVTAGTDVIGSGAGQIKAYLEDAYAQWDSPLEFVVLAGDADGAYAVATWHETLSGYNGEGDHYYTQLAAGGNPDILPDVHIGRLSFQSLDQLGRIVDKLVTYESAPAAAGDPGWFTRGCLVGDPSESGPSTIFLNQWVKSQLLNLGYSEVDTIWSGNFASQMLTKFGRGDTVIGYRGFWGVSGFAPGHTDYIGNGYKLPFAVIITCGTGSFHSDTNALSEAFVRADGGGAIACIGTATPGTHTRYNNCMYQGIFDGVLNSGDFRVGPALSRGKLEMYNNYQLSEPHHVEIWSVWHNLMGDPATEIFTAEPTPLTVTHPTSLAVDANAVQIEVRDAIGEALSGARVAVYQNYQQTMPRGLPAGRVVVGAQPVRPTRRVRKNGLPVALAAVLPAPTFVSTPAATFAGTGAVAADRNRDSYWHIDNFNCQNLDLLTPNNHAWWCGTYYDPCDAEDPAGGYGNNWSERLDWRAAVADPGNSVTVRVDAFINYDLEIAYDFLYLEHASSTGMQVVATFNDIGEGVHVNETFTVAPGDFSGVENDEVHLRWYFYSDIGWSDEDCSYASAGAAQIDRIQVFFDQGSGEVQIGETETCEAGSTIQWGVDEYQDLGGYNAMGVTDDDGLVTLPLSEVSSGPLQVTVTGHNRRPYLGNITLEAQPVFVGLVDAASDDGPPGGNDNDVLNPGETFLLTAQLMNHGTEVATGVTATLQSSDPHATVLVGASSYGNLAPGASNWGATPFTVAISESAPDGHVIRFDLVASAGGESWASLVEAAVGSATLAATATDFGGPGGDFDPGESGLLTVRLENSGSQTADALSATLISPSSWLTVTDAAGSYGSIAPGGQAENLIDPFAISIAAECFPGHVVDLQLVLEFSSGARVTTVVPVTVGVRQDDDPCGPDEYGYYAFDDHDVDYAQAPAATWWEIDPDHGGFGQSTSLDLPDFGSGQDATVAVDLPFTFRYYGRDHDRVSVCSNGWLAMGVTSLTPYRNWNLPSAGTPNDLIAVFWDNLYLEAGLSDVLMQYDESQHRVIFEWSRLRNHYGDGEETFEVILYDPAYHPTDTGDGIIEMQYLVLHNVDAVNGYATVGIQNHDHTDGLTYSYWAQFPPGGSLLSADRALRFLPVDSSVPTGVPPAENPDNPHEQDDPDTPNAPALLRLAQNHPNPFNPRTEIAFSLPAAQAVRLRVYDVEGRLVRTLVADRRGAGEHRVVWDGLSETGDRAASGVYFYRLVSEAGTVTRKMLLLK